jgi:hypothetical protein
MAIQVSDNFMALEIGGAIIATARFSKDAAADGNGAWIVSAHPARLFTRSQAITADPRRALGRRVRRGRSARGDLAEGAVPVMDRLIRLTTALAVLMVAGSRRSSPTSTPTISSHRTARRASPCTCCRLRWTA